jgi:hypothetical protein
MMRARVLLAVALCALPLHLAYMPPEQYRHEQLTAMQAAFSRFSGTDASGTLERQDLPDFLRFVVTAMNSAAMPKEQVIERSTELTSQLMKHLPDSSSLTLDDLLRGTEKIISYPAPTAEEEESERGRLGATSATPRDCLLPSSACSLSHSLAHCTLAARRLEAAATAAQAARAQPADHAAVRHQGLGARL